jgi:AAHS family 4-hydroxybenzoate transporter-like MFS transporter
MRSASPPRGSADVSVSAPVDVGVILDEGAWGARQKRFVALTALTIIFDGLDNQLLPVSLPAIMKDWALPRASFAPVLASGMVGMMIGGAIGGIAGDRIGRRRALIGSALLFGCFTAAIATADSLLTVGLLRFFAALGLGGALPNAAALSSEFVPRRHRAFAVTLTIVCIPAGGTLAAFVGGRMLPAIGWRALFVIGGLLPLVIAAIVSRLLPESPRYLARHPERWLELARTLQRMGHPVSSGSAFVDGSEQTIAKTSVRLLFKSDLRRDTLALCGAFFFCLLAVYVGFNWIPSMLAGEGMSPTIVSNGLTAFNLGGVAGAIAGGLLIGRYGSRRTMLGMAAVAVCGAVALAGVPVSAGRAFSIVVLLGITGGMINAVQTTLFALAAHVYPTIVRATGVGTAVAVGRSGGVLSTYAGAWALEAGGSAAFFATIAAAMTLVLACLAVVRRHVPRKS